MLVGQMICGCDVLSLQNRDDKERPWCDQRVGGHTQVSAGPPGVCPHVQQHLYTSHQVNLQQGPQAKLGETEDL